MKGSFHSIDSSKYLCFACDYIFRLLDNNLLSGTIPSSIGKLAQLIELYVHSCFQFHQQTHIKTNSFNPNFSIFVWLCSVLLVVINWVERSLHRSVILFNFANCMFILAFNSASKVTSILIFQPNYSIFVIMFRQLYSNQLSGTIPSSVGYLAQLVALYVHFCFHFRQQTHIKTNSFNPKPLFFVWLFSEILVLINWQELSLLRLVILPNFNTCMFVLLFNSTSEIWSKLTLSTQLLYFVCE